MRYLLIPTLLLVTTNAPRADDLNDLPELACAEASTPLEREHIGCPKRDVAHAEDPSDSAVRFNLEPVEKN